MENTINVQEVIKTAIDLEKVKTELVEAKSIIKTLQDKITKENSPKVVEIRHTTKESNYNPYTGYSTPTYKVVDIITTDLTDAMERIKAELIIVKDSEIEGKEKLVKKLTSDIKDLKESLEERASDNKKHYDRADKARIEKFTELEKNLRKEIEELEEELEKERNNKTDAELEKKRKEEIAALKVRVKELEKEITIWLGLNFFQRMWRKLTQYKARLDAEMKAAENKEVAEDVMDRYGWSW
jgi:hypothetical protein